MKKHELSSSISIKNKHSAILMPVVLLVVDYAAILCAEMVSFHLRNLLVPETTLRLSWLSIHVIIPFVYIIFMQSHELYTRRTQFWRIMSEIFSVNLYSIGLLVFVMYLAQTASQTSRLFVGLLCIFAFTFLVIGRYIIKKGTKPRKGAASSNFNHGCRKDGGLGVGILAERRRFGI